VIKAAFLGNNHQSIDRVYAQGRFEQVAGATDLYPVVVSEESFAEHAAALRDVRAVFGTWGFPRLTAEQLEQLPNLEIVFYGAGSVQAFARPFLERGITVVSAWAANAVPVAEFTLAQVLLATKGYFQNIRQVRSPEGWRGGFRGPGNYGETVAILGLGMIGRLVVQMLKPFELKVVVRSEHMSDEEAESLGVRRVTFEEAFSEALVVSNHLANRPHTVGLLNYPLLASMRPDAVFINTGRGAQVVEPDLIRALEERPDLTALLDVTYPEPPAEGSPLYALPNVYLSSHIAGSIGDEVVRMADYVLREFEAWQAGKPLRWTVSMEMLETMA
jgi:phosphoglycerate dehydrogenase-like enzyme